MFFPSVGTKGFNFNLARLGKHRSRFFFTLKHDMILEIILANVLFLKHLRLNKYWFSVLSILLPDPAYTFPVKCEFPVLKCPVRCAGRRAVNAPLLVSGSVWTLCVTLCYATLCGLLLCFVLELCGSSVKCFCLLSLCCCSFLVLVVSGHFDLEMTEVLRHWRVVLLLCWIFTLL